MDKGSKLVAQELDVWAHFRDSPGFRLLFQCHGLRWISRVLYGHSTASGSKEGAGGANSSLRAVEWLHQKNCSVNSSSTQKKPLMATGSNHSSVVILYAFLLTDE